MQLNAIDVQQRAGVDNKTLASVLQGTRWSTAKVRGRIEASLAWPPGEIERAARGATGGRPSIEDLSDGQLIAELARRLGSVAVAERQSDDLAARRSRSHARTDLAARSGTPDLPESSD
jgi:hypothetical protein